MNLRLALGALVVLAGLVAAVFLTGGDFGPPLPLLPLAAVLVAPVGVLLAGPGFAPLRSVLACRGDGAASRELEAAAAALKAAERSLVLGATTLFVVHFTDMMRNLEDKAAVWPNLAWALAPVLVALVARAVFVLPIRRAIAEARAVLTEEGAPGKALPEAGHGASWSAGRYAAGSALILLSIFAFNPRAFLGWLFVDAAALVLVAFVAGGMLLAGNRPATLARAATALRATDASKLELGAARRTFSYCMTVLGSAASLAFATGLVFLVRDALDRMRTGPNLALMFVSAFYCLVIAHAFVLPLEAEARRRELMAD
ncbi:MAG TPA: hypothetical protein PKW82_01435 [Spirochaetales bacterium]|nr:hypothetical protein [Spirochaetales bacterium]